MGSDFKNNTLYTDSRHNLKKVNKNITSIYLSAYHDTYCYMSITLHKWPTIHLKVAEVTFTHSFNKHTLYTLWKALC